MCLGIPAIIERIEGENAFVRHLGVKRKISIMLVPDVKVGDYVIVHAGFAIQRLDKEEAEKTLKLIEEIGSSQ